MANQHTVLIIEDESNIARFMTMIMTVNQYEVWTAENGRDGLMMITSYCPDVIILDLGLPDMDGLEIIRSVRQWSQMPIIVVSARSHERDKVKALDEGADDYVTKPFGSSELLARIRTALRHANNARLREQLKTPGIFTAGKMNIDYGKRRVFINGEEVKLTQTEFNILCLLSRYAGRVLTYDFLLKEIWGPAAKGDNQILRVNLANIRRKIEENPAEPRYIFTETGVGYQMVEGD
ncbi:MAG: response regulator transcription factor [Peptococcaceae bacterium]|nr:response regulator transcription factor [Peptococcaceae bacterium]